MAAVCRMSQALKGFFFNVGLALLRHVRPTTTTFYQTRVPYCLFMIVDESMGTDRAL